jgi:hypothetical protein
MGWGLGKNSPIVLSLGRGNYEAMLLRHGQNVRWRVSRKCTCITNANSPDPRCKKCGGSGERYDYQKDYTDSMRIRTDGNMIELPPENINCKIIKAYDSSGIEFIPSQMGQYVKLFNPQRELNNGEIIEIVYRQPITEIIDETELDSMGHGYYRVPGVFSDISHIEGVDYRAPGDVVDIEAVFDAKGEEVDILEYRSNTVLLKDDDSDIPIRAFGVKFIKPFKFFVLSQNLDEEDEKLLKIHEGDAISTFPYHFDVSEGDVITVLSGTTTKKVVIKHRDGDDIIMDFFVHKIIYLATNEKEYTEGIDFVIFGSNKIRWIEERPEVGENMSITYQYLPTYRVFKFIPMLRTSEDQRIPKKVVLKLFSAFTESRGVNRS